MLAAEDTHPQTVHLLLERGADVNARDSMGETALINACRWPGATEIVADLLRHGADVKVRSKNERTALIEAKACHADREILRLLRHAGAGS